MSQLNSTKNILYVYHRLDVIGGIETRWMDEFIYLQKHGFNTHLFTNKNACNPDLIPLFSHCKVHTYPFSDINNATEFVHLVETFVYHIEQHNIDVIHIHMQNLFAFAAVIAAQLCQVAVISTTHGILELYQKPIETLLFGHIARNSYSINAYVNNLPASVGLPNNNNKINIPNLVNFKKYQENKNVQTHKWLIVSRISEEKFPSILEFIKIAYHCQIKSVHIAGGGNTKPLLDRIEKKYKEMDIVFLGERNDIATILPQYNLLAGMGRVALEGLACQIPVCIITPDGKLKGLVTPANFNRLKDYNFTGNTLKTLLLNEFDKQLLKYDSQDVTLSYQLLKNNLSTDKWNDFIPLYQQTTFIDNSILNRLFHKITYFSKSFTTPFIEDKFFFHLLYETLIEEKQEHIVNMFNFYNNTYELATQYPNPYRIKKPKNNKFKRFLSKDS